VAQIARLACGAILELGADHFRGVCVSRDYQGNILQNFSVLQSDYHYHSLNFMAKDDLAQLVGVAVRRKDS
jgi:hypothetical protein